MSCGFEIEDVTLWRQRIPAARPFRFGVVTVDALTQLFARVTIRVGDGREWIGHAADFAAPRWFRKDPSRTLEQDVTELEASALRAAAVWQRQAQPATSAFACWHAVYRDLVASAEFEDVLVAGFGVALLERAVLDAVCRAADLPFHAALCEGVLGFDATVLDPPLEPWLPAAAPRRTLRVRHTVGMADDLEATLPEAAREFGIDHYKIKVRGDVEADRQRLVEIAGLLRDLAPAGVVCTLDGNETFADLEQVATLLEGVAKDPAGRWLLEGLAFVEQPLNRFRSFDPARHAAAPRVQAFAPLVLDEADVRPGSLRAGWPLGYRGVSAKTCKGTFRALTNAAFCAQRDGAFLCGEDLTTLPVLPLQQDLALLGTLGVGHAERNGHHFFDGLAHLTTSEREMALQAHPELYRPQEHGGAALRIEGGELQIGSLLDAPGFGGAARFDAATREPLG